MSRKAISVSMICMMLIAALAIVGMTVGKSKSKHATHQKPDPPGTINGATNPELISDHVAWSAMLALIASHKTPEKKKSIRSYIRLLGLGCAKCQRIQGAAPTSGDEADEADIDKLIGVAEVYDEESKRLDTLAGFPSLAPASLSEQERASRVNDLKGKKQQLVAAKVVHLSQHLTRNGYEALRNSLDKVKRGVKIVPYPSMSPGKK